MSELPKLTVVIPAAGIGKRMQANQAKQYLILKGKTILQHTVERFIDLPYVDTIVVAIANNDSKFSDLDIANHSKVTTVFGGKERADSVLQGLSVAQTNGSEWVMVHDAARPCVTQSDIDNLYRQCLTQNSAGILASPVRDTMKKAKLVTDSSTIAETIDRTDMWHALTPQCAKTSELKGAIESQLDANGLVNKQITDEASALELANKPVLLVTGSVKNIKITMPEDLELAEFYLTSENKN
ncbi:MAG: 2-C-methyl-D-erythritol 4-phosphate cytidylyltransferase [Gammaproteobacteria bacterium]|nr:2-C-methyl-D-erythritol 4-phosphate cytidylyltransferase [Gammaproteobacteria bacterium]